MEIRLESDTIEAIEHRLVSLTLLTAALLGFGNAACKQKVTAPPLPKVVTSGFPENVRAQVDSAVRDAIMTPDDAGATGRLGMVLQAYQQLDLAELCYRRARAMDPKVFDWAYYLSVVELVHGEVPQAIDDARDAVKLDPSSRPARMRLADARLQGHDFRESRRLYEQLVAEEPDRALFQYGLGKVMAAQGGSIVEAIPHLKRAAELSPAFSAAHYALSRAYREISDMEQSSRELLTYQNNPAGTPPEDTWMAQITSLNHGGMVRAETAEQYLEQGKFAEAARQMEAAVASDPGDALAQTNLVTAYWKLKQFDKAEEHYRIAVRLNPSTSAHYVFGLIMLDQGRFAEAATAFRRALDLNGRDSGAHTQLGRVLELQGDADGAIHEYEIALQGDPNSRAAHYVLGVALLKKGQPQQAIENLLKTLEPVDAKTPGYMRQLSEAYRKAGDETNARRYGQLPDGTKDDSQNSVAALAGQTDLPVRQAPSPPPAAVSR